MRYYSTNGQMSGVALQEAVLNGLAPDGGLYMPEQIPVIPRAFFNNMPEMSIQDIGYVVANTFFGQDIDSELLKEIVRDTFNFPIPLVEIDRNRYVLELFHGPSHSFKDVGTRFMARLLAALNKTSGYHKAVNVLVSTSGDTGAAVAQGFYGIKDMNVFILYPKGKISRVQEAQFATLGSNIKAIEVNGNIGDCRRLLAEAFMDTDLREQMTLTSANSLNLARLLPQVIHYFGIIAELNRRNIPTDRLVISVPSGSLGNLTAGLIAKRMGLPIKRLIAASNGSANIPAWGKGELSISNTDAYGNPSNMARIAEMYSRSTEELHNDIRTVVYYDDMLTATISGTYRDFGYIFEPHGAAAFKAIDDTLADDETGVALATVHPAKYASMLEPIVGRGKIEQPAGIAKCLTVKKTVEHISPHYQSLKNILTGKYQSRN